MSEMYPAEHREKDKAMVAAQQRNGWYCWGCGKTLGPGVGVVVTRWPKFAHGPGLYCSKTCAP